MYIAFTLALVEKPPLFQESLLSAFSGTLEFFLKKKPSAFFERSNYRRSTVSRSACNRLNPSGKASLIREHVWAKGPTTTKKSIKGHHWDWKRNLNCKYIPCRKALAWGKLQADNIVNQILVHNMTHAPTSLEPKQVVLAMKPGWFNMQCFLPKRDS